LIPIPVTLLNRIECPWYPPNQSEQERPGVFSSRRNGLKKVDFAAQAEDLNAPSARSFKVDVVYSGRRGDDGSQSVRRSEHCLIDA
jgi:hypothetical protein